MNSATAIRITDTTYQHMRWRSEQMSRKTSGGAQKSQINQHKYEQQLPTPGAVRK